MRIEWREPFRTKIYINFLCYSIPVILHDNQPQPFVEYSSYQFVRPGPCTNTSHRIKGICVCVWRFLLGQPNSKYCLRGNHGDVGQARGGGSAVITKHHCLNQQKTTLWPVSSTICCADTAAITMALKYCSVLPAFRHLVVINNEPMQSRRTRPVLLVLMFSQCDG